MSASLEAEVRVNKPLPPLRERFRKACGLYLKNHNTDNYRDYYVSVVGESTIMQLISFMQRADIPKGVKVALIGKLRYETSDFPSLMDDVINHYPEAMALRERYKSQQTYRNLIMLISGLNSYGKGLSSVNKSNLLGVAYSALSISSPYSNEDETILRYVERESRRIYIGDDDIVALVLANEGRVDEIQRMIASGVTEALKIERVLAGEVSSAFSSGIL